MTADADVGRYPPMAAPSIDFQIFSPFRHHVSHHATSCFDSAGSGESCMLFCSARTPIARNPVFLFTVTSRSSGGRENEAKILGWEEFHNSLPTQQLERETETSVT